MPDWLSDAGWLTAMAAFIGALAALIKVLHPLLSPAWTWWRDQREARRAMRAKDDLIRLQNMELETLRRIIDQLRQSQNGGAP